MKTIFSFIDRVVEALGIMVICVLIVITSIQVFCRYVLGNALSWPEEISLMLFCWMAYLGLTMAMKKDAHLRVDAFVMTMPANVQRILHLVCLAGAALTCAVIAYMSFETSLKILSRGQTAISVPLPIGYVWLGIPLGFALATLQAMRRFYMVLLKKEN